MQLWISSEISSDVRSYCYDGQRDGDEVPRDRGPCTFDIKSNRKEVTFIRTR